MMKITELSQLNQFLDANLDEADADQLFASAYVRGFIDLHAVALKNEQLNRGFVEKISQNLSSAKNELAPRDQSLVQDFWQHLIALIDFE